MRAMANKMVIAPIPEMIAIVRVDGRDKIFAGACKVWPTLKEGTPAKERCPAFLARNDDL